VNYSRTGVELLSGNNISPPPIPPCPIVHRLPGRGAVPVEPMKDLLPSFRSPPFVPISTLIPSSHAVERMGVQRPTLPSDFPLEMPYLQTLAKVPRNLSSSDITSKGAWHSNYVSSRPELV